jgi:NADH dehydrogenase/NADH:ubiquinone oxidoreductase subunit G
MAEVILNGQRYPFNEGETVLDVASRNGIRIPTLCYLKEVTPIGACRLCLVQVDGKERLHAACMTYAVDGMSVETNNEYVWKHRKLMLDFILIKHPLDCGICDKAGECILQDTAYEFGMYNEIVSSEKPKAPKEYWNKIVHNPNLCVLCEKCLKSCHEMTGCSALQMENRAHQCRVNTVEDGQNLHCDFCGTCIDRCPVGALLDAQFQHQARVWDLVETTTASPFSGSEGDVVYGMLDGVIERGKSVEGFQISSQSRFAYKYIYSPERVQNPLVKTNGKFAETSWEEVQSVLKDRLSDCKPENTAMLMGSRITNEAIASYKQLMTGIGSKKIVTEADFTKPAFMKLYKEKFGTYANLGNMEDLKKSDVIFVIGTDLRREAIGLKWRMMNSVMHNDCKLVSIGLQKYEYDVFTNKSLLADYGDYGSIFEKIKNDDSETYRDIREFIASAKKVSIIVGDEYVSVCQQLEAVLALADFVGKEKLTNFFVANDKTNIYGLYAQGLFNAGYSVDELIKDLESGKIKNLFLAGFNNTYTGPAAEKLKTAVAKAQNIIAADLFSDGTASVAHVLLPAKASLEVDGSFVKIGGCTSRVRKITDPTGTQMSDTEIAALLGSVVKVPVMSKPDEIYNTMLAGKYGFPEVKFSVLNSCLILRSTHSFNPTPYKYEPVKQEKKVHNFTPRYHSGTITAKGNYSVKTEYTTQVYHFEQESELTTEKKLKVYAEGISFVPKKF